MAKSTPTRKKRKVPLSVDKATGYWCKVHRGTRHYFEKVNDDLKGIKSLGRLPT